MTNMTEKLRALSPFKIQGLSFDPQRLLIGDETTTDSSAFNSEQNPPQQVITPSDSVLLPQANTTADEVQLSEQPSDTTAALQAVQSANRPQESTSEKPKTETSSMSHISQQLYVFRRIMFFVFLLFYIIALPVCLL
ncbi:unnamed protein product [Enterobius vermicularis]|uniref:Miff domain-containing protein n=1 Tax=Enterobius vermicularis TaxID=51028 RepID=A0A0N4VLY8_ENTVE|nr:unnamed protein product [Enterobius vermicularis]